MIIKCDIYAAYMISSVNLRYSDNLLGGGGGGGFSASTLSATLYILSSPEGSCWGK